MSTSGKAHDSIVRSAGAISLLTFLSRITGYLRDLLLAQMLGAANSSDAFIIAFRIPNLFRRLVGEGSLTAAFVPTLSEYSEEDQRREMWRFASLTFTTLAVVVAVICALGVLFSPLLVRALAWGFSGIEDKWDLTVALNRLMFPYLLFISLSALAMATLNTVGSFALPASTPIFLNFAIISVAWLMGRRMEEPAWAFAWGVLLGGLLQLGIQIPALWRRGWRPVRRVSFTHPGIIQVGRLMLPGILGLGVTQIMMIVSSQFASFLGVGAVSALYYAGRVNELALGVFAISISTAILPALSRLAAKGRFEEMRTTLLFGLRMAAFITVPSAAGLVVLRREVVTVLFKRGAFNAAAVDLTSGALLFYALGLFSFGAVRVVAPAFYARKDTRTPALIAAVTLGIHVLLCSLLTGPMGLSGVALADSSAATLNMTLLLFIFRRRFGLPILKSFVAPVSVFLVSSAAMGALSRPVLGWLRLLLSGVPMKEALSLSATLLLMAGFYFALCALLGRDEPRQMLTGFNPLRRRLAPKESAS
ncbi:MAG TPA: murein biosynthesis integral membrane protein MurJ [Candidatus Saccharimonadales bacterium]|nr:murein biosynthesis integral membrane protein MurJ [Candidatus Saccharimonadales bacterium]